MKYVRNCKVNGHSGDLGKGKGIMSDTLTNDVTLHAALTNNATLHDKLT